MSMTMQAGKATLNGLFTTLGILTLSWTVALAEVPVNKVHTGQNIPGGVYYNTPDSRTTFRNTGSGGLWLKAGTTIRGVESLDSSGKLTNNGGTIQFYAPGSVVRLDGAINVNAVLNQQGAALGNGGRVFVDAAYVFQNGQIYANGINGGLVQYNVTGLTMSPGAKIEANGYGGLGGNVSVNASGVVDIQNGAKIDTSGQTALTFDHNVISLEGSIVNMEGVLRADGTRFGSAGSRGGIIRLVATGQTDLAELNQAWINAASPISNPTLTAAEHLQLLARNMDLNSREGSVHIGSAVMNPLGKPTGGWISANGSNGPVASNNTLIHDPVLRAGDGGSITLAAAHIIENQGYISANGGFGATNDQMAIAGGNGGTIAAVSQGDVFNQNDLGNRAVFQSNGGHGGQLQWMSALPVSQEAGARGGNGGLIALSYGGQMTNSGGLIAKGGTGGHGVKIAQSSITEGHGGSGGQGGLIVISGAENPTASTSGEVGQLNANGGRGGIGRLGDGLGGSAGSIVSPVPDTLNRTQIAFQSDGGNSRSLFGLSHPVSAQTQQHEILARDENYLELFRTSGPQGASRTGVDAISTYRNYILGSSVKDAAHTLGDDGGNPRDTHFAYVTVVNNGNVNLADALNPTAYGGSHLSVIANGDISTINENGANVYGDLVGGNIHLASSKNISIYNGLNTNTERGFALHGGSRIFKARQDIIESTIFSNDDFPIQATALMGTTNRYLAGNNILVRNYISADAGKPDVNTVTTGGIITLKAGNAFNHPIRSLYYQLLPAGITANAAGPKGYGGYIHIQAKSLDMPIPETITASGSAEPGIVILETK